MGQRRHTPEQIIQQLRQAAPSNTAGGTRNWGRPSARSTGAVRRHPLRHSPGPLTPTPSRRPIGVLERAGRRVPSGRPASG